jgi:hypothetical protein
MRRLALPSDVKHWSLTTLREKLVKIGAKVTRHAKYVTFQLAEVAVSRRLFAAILDRIALLAIPPPSEYGCMYELNNSTGENGAYCSGIMRRNRFSGRSGPIDGA